MEKYFIFVLCWLILTIIAVIAGRWIKEEMDDKYKCPNCRIKVEKLNLFCPWCHRDLRGGGED